MTLNAKSNNESVEEDDYEIENDENYELAQEKRNKVTLYSKNHKQTASSNKVSSSEALNSSVNIFIKWNIIIIFSSSLSIFLYFL